MTVGDPSSRVQGACGVLYHVRVTQPCGRPEQGLRDIFTIRWILLFITMLLKPHGVVHDPNFFNIFIF